MGRSLRWSWLGEKIAHACHVPVCQWEKPRPILELPPRFEVPAPHLEISRLQLYPSQIFGMLNIWSCRQFTILLCAMISDWKLHRRWPSANERQRYRAEGNSGRSYRPEYQYFNRYTVCTIISYRNKHKHLLDQPQHQHYCKIIIYLSLQNTQSLFPASPFCIICFSFCSWKSAHRQFAGYIY